MTRRVSLCIADRDHVLGRACKEMLASAPDLDVVGIPGATGVEDIPRSMESKPDVFLLGTKRQGLDVIAAFQSMRERYPGLGVVLVSASCSTDGGRHLREFTWKASRGYACLSNPAPDDGLHLLRVIHAVAQGRVVLDPLTMEMLIESAIADRAL